MPEMPITSNQSSGIQQNPPNIDKKSGYTLYNQTAQSNQRESLVKGQFEKLYPEQRNQLANQFVDAASRQGINKIAETPDGQHALKEIYNNASKDQQAFMREVHKAQGNTAVDYTGNQTTEVQNQSQSKQQAARSCQVTSGPEFMYGPDNNSVEDIRRPRNTQDGFQKYYILHSTAKFAHDPKHGVDASCCVYRHKIAVDQANLNSKNGPPHAGFPDDMKPNTFYEDRNNEGVSRYGYRSFAYKNTNGYTTNGVPDQRHGRNYYGYDYVLSKFDIAGTYRFKGVILDRCNGNRVVQESKELKIDWNNPQR
jgi:hypothetical protein